MEIKSFDDIDTLAHKKGYGNVLSEITELCRGELLETPRTTQKAQDTLIHWWNTLHQKPELKEHRTSYFLFYELRKKLKEVV